MFFDNDEVMVMFSLFPAQSNDANALLDERCIIKVGSTDCSY